MSMRLGFIGAGNMGTALLKGIVGSGFVAPRNINIYDVDHRKTAALKEETGVGVLVSNKGVVENSDIVILAVKPAYIRQALEECRGSFGKSKILVSIAVGVSKKTLGEIIGEDVKVVRTMPNICVTVGEGMTLMSFDADIRPEEKETVKKLFECSGKAEELDEKFMSEVASLTGSGPAYVFLFIEAMADAAVQSGIPRKLAYSLASQAVLGSAKMVLESGLHPGELKDQVCSPAGTTIEAIYALEKNGFRYAIMDAMNECTKKAREIGNSTSGK